MEKFLCDLPIGAVGLDVGCGNGKYLTVNPDIFIVGSDRSVIGTKKSPSSLSPCFFLSILFYPITARMSILCNTDLN